MPKLPNHQFDTSSSIAEEFASAPINDRRLVKRLCRTAEKLAEQPEKSIPAACGSWVDTKGAYELFDNKKVDSSRILAGHRECTIKRISIFDTVLDIQDSTQLNYDNHRMTKGLGPVNDFINSLGLWVHTSLAVSTTGVPLGLLSQEIWARDAKEHGKRSKRKSKEILEKESNKWLVAMDQSLRGIPDSVRVITVCDREGDIFDFAAKAVAENHHLLFRVAQNRCVKSEDKYLFEHASHAPVQGQCTVDVPRNSGNKQPPRKARLTVRACPVTIQPPKNRAPNQFVPITLYLVEAREENAPAGVEPLHWLLLTTLTVSTMQEAAEKIEWYRHRWKIERFHYILKSGCKVEDLQLGTEERLKKAVTLYSVIAWRLAYITYQARETPEMPCCVVFSQTEWQGLWRQANPGKKLPMQPPPLKDAVLWLAKLGGFLGRKGDGYPGVKVLWSGLQNLNIGMRFLARLS